MTSSVTPVTEEDLRIVRHRDDLWLLGIEAALLRAKAKHRVRLSRWHARRARRLLRQHLVSAPPPRTSRRSGRRKSRRHLNLVTSGNK